MQPIQIISQDLFDKVRSRFQNLEMGDETGAVTINPTEARFFDFDFVIEGNNLGRVSISLNDLGSLKVYYSQGITENHDDPVKKEWYNFLKEMRFFAMRRILRFDARDIAKTNLDKNDFKHLATTQGKKEKTVAESKRNLKQGVAEGSENFNGIDIDMDLEGDEIMVRAMANGRELGHVIFVEDGEYLLPQDLEVDERYQGQGIAATMYDYVKSKGYKIRRSCRQTDAGAGFWAKHRPEQNVWEQGVAEGSGGPSWPEVISALTQGYPDIDPTDALKPLMQKYRVSYNYFDKLAQQQGYKDVFDAYAEFEELPTTGPTMSKGVAEGYWQDAVKKAEASRKARKGKPFEKNPASHDKQGVYIGDKDLAGNPVPKRKDQGVAEGSTMSWIVYRQDTTLYPNGERDHETEVVKTFNNDQEAEDYAKKLNAANRDYDVYYFVRGKQQGVAEDNDKNVNNKDSDKVTKDFAPQPNQQNLTPDDAFNYSGLDPEIKSFNAKVRSLAGGRAQNDLQALIKYIVRQEKHIDRQDKELEKLSNEYSELHQANMDQERRFQALNDKISKKSINDIDVDAAKQAKEIEKPLKPKPKVPSIDRDYTESVEKKEMTMNESRWDGKNSRKTSRAVKGRTEVIVRHAKPVEETYPGARSQKNNIKAIFIQNADGERYKYPFIHPAGAFAMAQHVDHGGIPHDHAGKAIIQMSEEIAKLQEFQRKIHRASLHDDAHNITERALARLNELKSKVHALGKRHHYENWVMEFNSSPVLDDNIELDAVTMENYKSKFTQTSFQEELASYFPLLHKIMRESNKVELEDIVSEEVTENTADDKMTKEDSNNPEHSFEMWAEAVESGTLTDDEINALKQALSELPQGPDNAPMLELGPEGNTAIQFFAEFGLDDPELVEKLQAAAKLNDESNALDAFALYAVEYAPDVAAKLGISNEPEPAPAPQAAPAPASAPQQATAEATHPDSDTPQSTNIMSAENDEMKFTNTMMPKEGHDPKDMIKEVAKIVKSFYNKDNPKVGPFRGHEGIIIDVKKSISEKFGDKAGNQAAKLAEKFMEKLTNEWQHLHGKTHPVDDTDGLARLKELLDNVKQKVEGIGEKDYLKYKEPTIDRIKKGETKPVDRTDYDEPAVFRDADKKGKKLSPKLDKLTDPSIKEMAEILKLSGIKEDLKNVLEGHSTDAQVEILDLASQGNDPHDILIMLQRKYGKSAPSIEDINLALRGEHDWSPSDDFDIDEMKRLSGL